MQQDNILLGRNILSDAIIFIGQKFPIAGHAPSIPAEVMAMGKCLILSKDLHKKEPYQDLVDGENVLIVDPKNTMQFRAIIENIIKNIDEAERIGIQARDVISKIVDFDRYVNNTILLYEEMLNRSSTDE